MNKTDRKVVGIAMGMAIGLLVGRPVDLHAQTSQTGSDGATYFGSARPTSSSERIGANPAGALPNIKATVAALAPTNPVPVETPAPSIAVASVSTQPAPAVNLSPLGKWRWHSGGEKTLMANGAVLQDSAVVGQWRWTNKTKGELQIQFNTTRGRPPMTYTMSPHGHHIEGTDPARKGQTFTEERSE